MPHPSDQTRIDSKDESGEHSAAGDVVSDLPSTETPAAVPDRKVRVLCPYCGRGTLLGARCEHCKGLLDPLSRQATQNSMGPWFIHDPQNPFRPGCSYEVIREQLRRGKIVGETVLRGPTTRQYWMIASRTPSVAHLLGKCHNCQKAVDSSAISCPSCSADFSPELDRQFMGLGPVHLLPGQASPEEVARAAQGAHLQSSHGSSGDSAEGQSRHARSAGMAAGGGAGGGGGAKGGGHASGVPASDATRDGTRDTGEYRALLSRMERLDHQLGTTRAILVIAGLAVLVLTGAVLWLSGVFGGATSSSDRWPTIEPPQAAPAALPTPAATSPPPAASNKTPEEALEEEQRQESASPAPADPDTGSPPQRDSPPDSPPDPAPKQPSAPTTSAPLAGAHEEADDLEMLAEWAMLRGLP